MAQRHIASIGRTERQEQQQATLRLELTPLALQMPTAVQVQTQ